MYIEFRIACIMYHLLYVTCHMLSYRVKVDGALGFFVGGFLVAPNLNRIRLLDVVSSMHYFWVKVFLLLK